MCLRNGWGWKYNVGEDFLRNEERVVMRYNSVLDLHTHTLVSGHAYCSLREMAKAASKKGLEVLGITEHAPAMPGTCHKYYFENLKIVPREMYGIQLLLGSEVNILDAQGTVDLAQRTLERMDVVIASLHMPCMKPGSKLENTESYLNVMKNPYVNIIGHPDDGRYEIDYEALVQGAKEYGKVLELNNHSMDPDCNRQNAVENDTVVLNLCKKYHVPVQSHLSENLSEIAWVRELCPYSSDYGEAYEHFGLFGGNAPTVMAHGVWPGKREFARIKERGVYIAHCPQSNTNIASGIAPVRQYLDAGIHIGLGSDVAGGSSDSIFRAMVDAIQVSKLRWRLITQDDAPIMLDEAFYMATAGGGEFFGKVGKFEEGYEFDAVVLDDENLPTPREFSTHERLERIVYLGDDRNIAAKFVAGRKLFG